MLNDKSVIKINDRLEIPLAELQFRFSTSSGPGGQHTNRAATKVTLLFDVAHSPSLSPEIRTRLLTRLATRLTKEGVLQIDVQDSRSQWRNRETAVSRFQTLLAEALKRPKKRKKTRPSRAAKERRLAAKKKQGERKKERSRKWYPDS